MAVWDYRANGQLFPGLDDDQIRALIRDGTITRDSEIAKAGTDRWQAVGVTGFRTDCERAEDAAHRRSRAGAGPSSEPIVMPDVRTGRVGFAGAVWIVLTVLGLAITWRTAEGYNPNGNGTFNMAEAAILGAQWTEVVAAFVSALLLFVVFGTLAVVGRLTLIAQVNRAGHIAVAEQLRALRVALERDGAK